MNQAPLTTRFARSVSVVPLPGLHLDALGHYLAALGLLRLAARKWTVVRGCWRNGGFLLVDGPRSFDEVVEYLASIGDAREWTPYGKPWDEFQKKDTKAKSADNSALWRARAWKTKRCYFSRISPPAHG